jgi:hypothetical protein
MLRAILMLLALIILIGIALVYMGILHWPGGGQPVQVRPAEVRMETRQVNVQVPVVSTPGDQPQGNAAAPAPAPQPAPQNGQ